MAITDITLGVPDLGNTASVTVGANSPAPYAGAQVTGLTDGTSPNNASRNKAEVYNRLLFAYRHAVEQAGLVFDKDNWAQMSQAISSIAESASPVATDTIQGKVALNLGTALPADATNATDALTAAGLNAMLTATPSNAVQAAVKEASALNPSQYGTLAGVGAPTAAPTAANPATELTNSNGEVFRWNGTSWYLSGNGTVVQVSSGILNIAGAVIIDTVTAPRNGWVGFTAYANIVSVEAMVSEKYAYFDFLARQEKALPANSIASFAGVSVGGISYVTAGQVIPLQLKGNGLSIASSYAAIKYIS